MNSSDIPIDQWVRRSRQGPTTICYASLCRYAEGCPNKTVRPRRLPQQRCPRYWPETLRPPATLSQRVREILGR